MNKLGRPLGKKVLIKPINLQCAVGLRILELRKERKLKQYDFEKIGIAAKVISSFENGLASCGLYRLSKIIKCMNVSFEEFFNHPNFKNLE